MKKFELVTECNLNCSGRSLFRIRACIDFTTASGDEVHKGDLGGFVEKESNLFHSGKAWICGNAKVYDDAIVCGDAEVCDNTKVFGYAIVCDNAKVCGDVIVCSYAKVAKMRIDLNPGGK